MSSLMALREILLEVIKEPQLVRIYGNLRAAIKSQGALASFELSINLNDGRCIHKPAISLNTLKSHADATISGGFKELDRLRKLALESIESFEKQPIRATKRTKSGLSIRLTELESELQTQRKTNYILLQAISTAMNGFQMIRDAPNADIREKRTDDSLQAIRAIIRVAHTLSQEIEIVEKNRTGDSSQVIDIKLYKKEPTNHD